MSDGKVHGVLAQFETTGQLLHAAEQVRDAGYKKWDCHSPFPVHGMNEAMGLRDTRLPWLALGGGFAGFLIALGMQWWMNAVDYPYMVSGKPLFSLPANIPVMFELTILISALTAFGSMFLFNDLPRFYHPVFRSERFRRVTDDKFFIVIEAADPKFDAQSATALLERAGSSAVEMLED